MPLEFVDWDRLRVFLVVVEAGSFTGAARKLDLSQSAVSRQVCSLEASLKIPLFYRHARGLRLTEHGEAFHETVKSMENQLSKVLERISDARTHAEGPLRITTTVAFGSAWLSPRIARFHQQYPDINVSVLLADAPELDLLSRQADVAIRFEEQTRGELIQQRLMSIRYHLYASKSYIAKKGLPNTLSELDDHELIVYGGGHDAPLKNFDWILHLGRDSARPRRPALRVNNVYGMYRAVKSGLGIAALPRYIVEDDANLQEIDLGDQIDAFDAYIVFAEDMRGSKRIEALRAFLMSEVNQEATELELAARSQGNDSSKHPVCLKCRHAHAVEQDCVFH